TNGFDNRRRNNSRLLKSPDADADMLDGAEKEQRRIGKHQRCEKCFHNSLMCVGSHHDLSPRNVQRNAGDPRGGFGAEKQRRGRDILRLAYSLNGELPREVYLLLVVHEPFHPRVADCRRSDGVYANSSGSELLSEVSRQHYNSGLSAGITKCSLGCGPAG